MTLGSNVTILLILDYKKIHNCRDNYLTTTLYHSNIGKRTSTVMLASVTPLECTQLIMPGVKPTSLANHCVDHIPSSRLPREAFFTFQRRPKNGVLKIKSVDKATIKMKLRSPERKIDSKLDFGQFFFRWKNAQASNHPFL